MASVEKKVEKLAEILNVDWSIVGDGRDILKKGQKIVKTIHYPAFGIKTIEEILDEYKDLNKKYDFDKIVYRVSTKRGHSRMYLIKITS